MPAGQVACAYTSLHDPRQRAGQSAFTCGLAPRNSDHAEPSLPDLFLEGILFLQAACSHKSAAELLLLIICPGVWRTEHAALVAEMSVFSDAATFEPSGFQLADCLRGCRACVRAYELLLFPAAPCAGNGPWNVLAVLAWCSAAGAPCIYRLPALPATPTPCYPFPAGFGGAKMTTDPSITRPLGSVGSGISSVYANTLQLGFQATQSQKGALHAAGPDNTAGGACLCLWEGARSPSPCP